MIRRLESKCEDNSADAVVIRDQNIEEEVSEDKHGNCIYSNSM